MLTPANDPNTGVGELPREFTIFFKYNGKPKRYIAETESYRQSQTSGTDGFDFDYADTDGERWRVSVRRISTEPIDEQRHATGCIGGHADACLPSQR